MSLTVKKHTIRKITAGQAGYFEASGAFVFSTTDITAELEAMMGNIEEFSLTPIGPPATVTREYPINLGTLSASGEALIIAPPYAGSLAAARIVLKTTVATDDTNFWTFRLINKGNADADMILATDANTNKVTGGSAITAYTPRALGLHGTTANLAFTANNALFFTAVKTASGVNLVDLALRLDFNVGDIGEKVYLDEAAQYLDGRIKRPDAGTITVARAGPAQTSGLGVAFRYRGY